MIIFILFLEALFSLAPPSLEDSIKNSILSKLDKTKEEKIVDHIQTIVDAIKKGQIQYNYNNGLIIQVDNQKINLIKDILLPITNTKVTPHAY